MLTPASFLSYNSTYAQQQGPSYEMQESNI